MHESSGATTMNAMIRFGRSAVDVPTRSIQLDGEPQHLEPQAFDLLAYLLEHRDRVIPKTELLDEVWGDQFVSESALTTRIKEIRRGVGDDGARQEVIKNFRGRGYRFVATIIDAAPVDAPGTNGPIRLATTLLGRDDDISATSGLLDRSRLVTLVGAGGVGKSSLARDVALIRRDLHADGTPVVRLASVRDAAAVRHQLRRDIGLDEAGPTDGDLIAAIASLDALVVIDNCEHVIGEVAQLIAAIDEQHGPVRVLATSRERLGLSAEQVWPVEPLDEDAARQLLLDRARSAQPDYAFPAGSDSIVEGLVNRLDRLPLAIEMAAARLPSLGLDDLVALLHDRLDLLRTSDRSADSRHRTIGELIGWSEDLLDQPERDVLTCLSAFAGPAVASDLAAVATVDSAQLVAGSLQTCVDHSLVVADTLRQPTAYRLLETVRASAGQRRTPNHLERHAEHVIDVTTEMDRMLRTPQELVAAQRLGALEADLRLAHQWAREHHPARAGELTAALIHYAYERQWTEPVTWARHLLDELEPSHPAWQAAAATCAADHANRGEYERAVALGEAASASTDPRVAFSAHDTLGNVGIYSGDLDTASHHLSMLREVGQQDGDAMASASALVGEAMVLAYGGQPEAALQHLENDDGGGTSTSPTGSAWIAYIHGDVLSALGREREALEQFDRSVALAAPVGSTFVVSVAQLSALAARSRVGDLDAARTTFVDLLSRYRRIRSITHAITALRNLVALLVRSGDHETAMVLLGALSSPDVKATYGAESRLLDEARHTAEEKVDDDLVEQWVNEGAAHDPLWALDHAISILS